MQQEITKKPLARNVPLGSPRPIAASGTPDGVASVRRPADLILLAAGLVLFLLTVLAWLGERGVLQPAIILFQALNAIPLAVPLLRAVVQYAALTGSIVVAALALVAGETLLARNLALGGIATWLLASVFQALFSAASSAATVNTLLLGASGAYHGFPSVQVAAGSALAAIGDGFLTHRWRRLTWMGVFAVAIVSFYVGMSAPVDVVGGAALGIVAGALTNLALGVREKYLPMTFIRESFSKRGITVKGMWPVSADARGSVPFFVEAGDGQEYFVKVVGTQQRNADFLFKLWRYLLFKYATGTPFLTPEQQIEHEAYLTLLAQKHGVRTPDVEFTERVEYNYALLAQKRVKGRELADTRGSIPDNVLTAIWDQVGKLHEARIYHGDLRLANLLIDEKQNLWVIDFGFASGGADDHALALDTAQLLASLAPLVGEEKAVNSALRSLGKPALVAALPALEPLLLSSKTRQDMQDRPKLLDEIQKAIEEETRVEEQEQESVFRIRRKGLLFALGLGAGMYFLLPQLGELHKVVGIWAAVNPPWLALGLVGSALAYLFAAIAAQGAVAKRLSLVRLIVAQYAATFGSRFSPQGVGGALVIERFLEKSGVEKVAAVTALAVSAAAGAAIHLSLILIVLPFVNVRTLTLVKNTQAWQFGVAGLLIAAVAFFLLRSGHRRAKLAAAFKKAVDNLRAVAQNKRRALELSGGAFGITASYTFTFYVSLLAIGAQISPSDAVIVYLVGQMIGAASPTVGGLGVTEGALAGGLMTFGMGPEQAVAATLLFRLLTFWLPILPGALAFNALKRESAV